MDIPAARKTIGSDILYLLRLLELETALNDTLVVRALNNTYEAHGFEAIRHELTYSAIRILARLTEKPSRDKASLPSVLQLIDSSSGAAYTYDQSAVAEFRIRSQKLAADRDALKKFRDTYVAHSLIVPIPPKLRYDEIDVFFANLLDCWTCMERVFGTSWDLGEIRHFEKRCARKFARSLARGVQISDTKSLSKRAAFKRRIPTRGIAVVS
jgi:hypothetical protein